MSSISGLCPLPRTGGSFAGSTTGNSSLGYTQNPRQLRGFLGNAGFCLICIPNYGLTVKPLFDASKGHDLEPLICTTEYQTAFETIKRQSQPLLSDYQMKKKTFKSYVHDRQGIRLGVLTQTLGNIASPVAYISKQLEHSVKGWPPCLQAAAATCDMLQEAEKLTLAHPTTLYVLHHVLSLLEQ